MNVGALEDGAGEETLEHQQKNNHWDHFAINKGPKGPNRVHISFSDGDDDDTAADTDILELGLDTSSPILGIVQHVPCPLG